MSWFPAMPLAASVLYVVGAMFIKRAAQAGFDVWRSSTVISIVTAVVFAVLVPLCPLGELPQPGPDWRQDWWQPTVAAVIFTVGQLLILQAFSRGDVSVATPALGAKSIFVAWFSTLVLQTALPWQLWASACMSTVAIVLLNRRGPTAATHQQEETVKICRSGSRQTSWIPRKEELLRVPLRTLQRQGETTVLALAAAASFALFDVLVQKWSASWGPGRFLPVLFGIAAVLSLGWIPLFPQAPARQLAAGASLGPARQLAEGASLGPIEPQSRSGPRLAPAADSSAGRDGKSAILWMLGGALFFSAQLLLLMLSVARDAVSVNIVYSLRSLWSVGLVWLIGHWFDNQERHMPTRLLIWRMAGAALMTAAIVLTVTRG